MPSPFPGMDPYLESADQWRSFHHNFATEIARQLNPLITPRYFADVEVRTVLEETGISMQYTTCKVAPSLASQVGGVIKVNPQVKNDLNLGSEYLLASACAYLDTAVFEVAPDQPQSGTSVAAPVAPIERLIDLSEPFKLRTVNIYETANQRIVTSIEILSPANKIGEGLRLYRQKRLRLLCSDIHLLEIDLLRRGERPGSELYDPPLDTDYVIVLSRASGSSTRRAEVWPAAINERLSTVPIPLLPPDLDVVLDLQLVFEQVYNDFSYQYRLDYTQDIPPPELRASMRAWWEEKKR